MALLCPTSLMLALCAALFMLFMMGVEGYSDGAPPESCDDMLPVHRHLGKPVSNITCDPCPSLEVVGYEGSNSFNYTCGMSYTLTAAVTSIMVEAREASNSFNSSMPHVGEFSLDGSTAELQIVCQGNAVTQSRILDGQPFNFTWIAPGPGNPRSVRFWFTVVPAPAAFYAQLVGPVGEPDPSSCTCDMNQFTYRPPGSPDTMTMCLACPANSSSATGNVEVCNCFNDTGRISEASGALDPNEPCTPCPGAPMAPNLIMATPPHVMVAWSPPPASSAWPLKYRVEWSNGTVLVDGLTTTSVVISGLNHLTQYSVVISALSNSSCMDGNVTYTFNTGQRCPSSPPQFIGTPDTAANGVTLVWDEPHITDPLILDPRYAVYSMCEGDATQALQADELQSSSFTISSLPASTQCTALVVLYSRHCVVNPTGPLVGTVTFTTAAKLPVGLISDPSGGQQQTLFIEVGDSPGTMLIRIVPEQGIPRYVVIYLDPSSPSTFVEVIRATTAGVSDWVIDVPQGGLYSVQCAGINADGVRGPLSSPVVVTIPRVTMETPQPEGLIISPTVFIACVVVLGVLLIAAILVILVCAICICARQSGRRQNTIPSNTANTSKETKLDVIGNSSLMSPMEDDSELQPKSTATSFNIFSPGLEESTRSSS